MQKSRAAIFAWLVSSIIGHPCSAAPTRAAAPDPPAPQSPAPQSPASQSPASQSPAPALEVIVLGSGGPGAVGRASASYVVLIEGVPRILVDAGSGAFVRLGEAAIPLDSLDYVLLTHLHVDHAAELPGLMKARAVSSSGSIAFQIFGPGASRRGGTYFPATSRFVDLLFGPRGAFAYLRDFAAPISIQPHDVARDPAVRTFSDFTLSTVAGHHGDAPAVIYRIEHGGRSVTFSGDIDAQGLPALRRIAAQTDLLVFDAVVLDPPGSPEILYTLHTPPRAIGELARDARVGALLLSHLSPATDRGRQAVTSSIRLRFSGPLTFAADGMHIRP